MDARPTETRTPPFDLVRLRYVWYGLSIIVIGVGLIALAIKGLNLGTDFTGGAEIQYETELPLPETEAERAELVDEIASSLDLGAGAVKAIVVSDAPLRREILVRFPVDTKAELDERQEEILGLLQEGFGERLGEITPASDATFVGPVVGGDLRSQAIICTIVGLAVILGYIWMRYNVKMATTGIIALIHDVLVMVGFTALLEIEVDASYVAALLTILGFSINDSVVIFDRIRENVQGRAGQKLPFAKVVNRALWETMARSINNSMTVVLVLCSVLLFGGSTLQAFATTLLIGMISGVYSSVFVASQIVVDWHHWEERRQAGKARAAAQARPTVGARRRRQEELERARTAAEEVAAGQPATAEGPSAETPGRPSTTKDRAQTSKTTRARDKARKSKRRY